MTQLELELAELRQRRQSTGLVAWFRSLSPFDRRSIREPDERDVYWINVQRRLVESDAAFLMRRDNPPSRAEAEYGVAVWSDAAGLHGLIGCPSPRSRRVLRMQLAMKPGNRLPTPAPLRRSTMTAACAHWHSDCSRLSLGRIAA